MSAILLDRAVGAPRSRAWLSVLAALVLPVVGHAQDAPPVPPGTEPDIQSAPSVPSSVKATLNGTYKVSELVEWYASIKKKNYVVMGDGKGLSETVRIVSHKDTTFAESERAMMSAIELAGYTIIEVGGVLQVIKSGDTIKEPGYIGEGDEIPYTAAYVTQIIKLENVSVSDVSSVVTTLSSSDAKIIAYAPTNTLIITDSAYNLRKTYKILTDLDVAAPRSRLEIVPVIHADASEIASIIGELYAIGEDAAAEAATSRTSRTRTARRPRRDEATPEETTPGVAGEESQFISKVLSDERTNSLIILANDQGHDAIKALLKELDSDVDLSSRSQIHVVYLQHAKAEDVASVLAQLSESGTTGRTTTRATAARTTPTATGTTRRGVAAATDAAATDEAGGGVLAAFDSGMRITHDENTNSLVIIAAPDDFEVVSSVIKKLDIRRRQVFVDAVLLEIASEDTDELGVAVHGPFGGPGEGSVGFLGAQLGASSLGLSQDLLSGLAMGVFGDTIDVPFTTSAGTQTVSVPAFGIVLSALKSNSLVNIVSNPNLMTLDNEEAQIVVGRKIPFPTSSGLNSLGQPVVSFQREDVATTLKLTPRVNSENFVTLEVTVEVSDIEEDSQGLDVNTAGFITSKREITTVALVGDNETVVLGGLVGTTDTEVETKIPILGDLPLLGGLFRGHRDISRKTNLLVFLTPHIIDDEDDVAEIMRVKEAQRQEFMRRFYGRSQDEQREELEELLQGSMNFVDRPSEFRGSEPVVESFELPSDPLGFGEPEPAELAIPADDLPPEEGE